MKNKLILFLLSLVTLLVPVSAAAALPPQSGDITVNGTVAGPPPASPPTIDSPVNGQVFVNNPITAGGSCDSGLLVRVFKNNIFAGSTLCQGDGTYSLQIDLVYGENTLLARQYDFLDQSSPDSNTVKVNFKPPTSAGINLPTDQVIIAYDFRIVGIFPGRRFSLPVNFGGGTGPYAVSIDWGDGKFEQKSQISAGEVRFEHTYEKAGYYVVKIRVTDVRGQTGYLQVILVVNGDIKTKTPDEIYNLRGGLLEPAWPILILAVTTIIAFSVGEYYQSKRDQRAFLSYLRTKKPRRKPARKSKKPNHKKLR